MKATLAILVALVCLMAFTTTSVSANAKCSVCKVFVGGVADQLKHYEGQIDDAFKRVVCTKFGRFEGACNKFVDKYGPIVIEALIKKLDPDVVCLKYGFCNSDKWIKELMSEEEQRELYNMYLHQQEVGQGAACDLCEYAVDTIKRYVNQTQDEIKEVLTRQCERLPDQMAKVCQTVVLLYGDKLIETVIQFPTEEACQKIGLCPRTEEPLFAEPPVILPFRPEDYDNVQDSKCPMCVYIAEQAHKYIASNATQEQIRNGMYRVCAIMPPAFAENCKELVDVNLGNLIDFIRQKYPPQRICEIIGFCEAKLVVVEEPPVMDKNGIPTCPLCMMVMSEIEKMLEKPDNRQKIVDTLAKVCPRLPKKFRSSCNMLVENYAPQIIDKVLDRFDPSAVCKFIKACKPAKVAEEQEKQKQEAGAVVLPKEIEQQLEKQNSQYCALCLQVASYVYTNIANNQTQEQIINALQKVCDHVSPNLRDKCKLVVPLAMKELIHWFLKNEKPSIMCQQLKLCDPRSPYCNMEVTSELVCKGCKTLVDIGRNFINKDSTIEEIMRALNRACEFFPPKYEGMCHLVVEQYGEEIVRKLADKISDSEKVCAAVRACPRSLDENEFLPRSPSNSKST